MAIERLLELARKLIDDLTFCVAVTQGEDGDLNARIVQPLRMRDDWTVDVLTNLRCRKVREIQRTGRMTLLYQHDADKSYVTLIGRAEIVEFLTTQKPAMTHVVLTGRNAKDELIEIADLVTEMTLVKHPFRSGIKAQAGVEF